MIARDRREVTAVHLGRRTVSAVYLGARLVWQAVRSCFGAGFWKNDRPWVNTEGWKNQ